MPGKKRVQDVVCGVCKEKFQSRNPKPGKDGVLRCKKCGYIRNRERFVEKHGASIYDVYQKNNPKYRDKRRQWQLKHNYGLSPEDYDKLFVRQGEVCAICRGSPSEGEHLVVDHDHESGKIRGLLCHPCNMAIGQLGDDLQRIRSAVSYLLRHNTSRSWDWYFAEIAEVVSSRSRDPSTRVGAVIVKDRAIISTGYNGFPRGVNDNVPERYDRPEKYWWTVHAEENSIFNAGRSGISTAGATMYVVPLHPCVDCAKAIVQSGIREVVVCDSASNERLQKQFNFSDAAAVLKASRVLVRSPE
jgi:dCMP deaminase